MDSNVYPILIVYLHSVALMEHVHNKPHVILTEYVMEKRIQLNVVIVFVEMDSVIQQKMK